MFLAVTQERWHRDSEHTINFSENMRLNGGRMQMYIFKKVSSKSYNVQHNALFRKFSLCFVSWRICGKTGVYPSKHRWHLLTSLHKFQPTRKEPKNKKTGERGAKELLPGDAKSSTHMHVCNISGPAITSVTLAILNLLMRSTYITSTYISSPKRENILWLPQLKKFNSTRGRIASYSPI